MALPHSSPSSVSLVPLPDAAVVQMVRHGAVELVVDALRLYQDWEPMLAMAMQLLCPLCRHGEYPPLLIHGRVCRLHDKVYWLNNVEGHAFKHGLHSLAFRPTESQS